MTTATTGARARLIAATLGATLGSLALAGCVDDFTAAAISNPVTHHPIAFGAAPESLLVEVPPGGGGLSRNQVADVYRFIERYKQESTGALRLEAPKSAGGHLAVSRPLRQVEELIENAGIDAGALQVVRRGGKSGHASALMLAYDRTIAVPPDCGDWSDDLGVNRERLPYNNFGCATQRNLALTVANGRDLQAPQQETPRSSERRSTTWSEYVGAPSGTAASTTTAPMPVTK